MLECDVIVYDLHTADLKEVEEKLSIFKTAKIEENKLIVVVSSVMVWANTPTKVLKENIPADLEQTEEKAEKNDKSIEAEEKKAEENNEVKEEKYENRPAPFEESDFNARVPHKDYTQ